MDIEGYMASMDSPAHHSFNVVIKDILPLAWLHLQRKSRRTKGKVENIFERKRAVIGNVLRTETFRPFIAAETWNTKLEKLHLGGCMANQPETEKVRNHSVCTSIYRDQHGGYSDCLFQRDPSHWAKHVPYVEIFKGATGDLLVTKAITNYRTYISQTPSTPKQVLPKLPLDERAKVQINIVAIRCATTGKLCQKHGKCQQLWTQDEILRNIGGEKPGPTEQYFCARNDGPPNRISYVYSKPRVTANQRHYSSSNHFCLSSIVAKNQIFPGGTW